MFLNICQILWFRVVDVHSTEWKQKHQDRHSCCDMFFVFVVVDATYRTTYWNAHLEFRLVRFSRQLVVCRFEIFIGVNLWTGKTKRNKSISELHLILWSDRPSEGLGTPEKDVVECNDWRFHSLLAEVIVRVKWKVVVSRMLYDRPV